MGLVSFIIGGCFGFIIWAISPITTGEIEPWITIHKVLNVYITS